MTIEREFLSMMASTVYVTPFKSRSTDGYGKPVYSTGAPKKYFAHAIEDVALIRKMTGQSTQVKHVYYLTSTATVSPQDKFSVDGTTKRIIEAYRVYDDEGVHHVKVLCG